MVKAEGKCGTDGLDASEPQGTFAVQHTCRNNINPLLKCVVVSCSLMWPETLKRDFLQTEAVHDNKEGAENLFINLLRVFHNDI